MTIAIKPKRSLGLKLLSGATILVLILMGSAYLLAYNFLKEETSTFTFELQSNQSQLLGQRFAHIIETVTHDLKTLQIPGAKAKTELASQEQLLSLEAYKLNGKGQVPNRFFKWNETPEREPPTPAIIKELLQTGLSYQAVSNSKGIPSVYLYSLLESGDPVVGPTIIKAKLNLSDLIRKSGGTQAQLVSRLGEILLDTRDPKNSGSQINPSNPLFRAAHLSKVSIGTLEYQMPETQDTHLGTYIIPGYNVVVLNTLKYRDAMKGAFMLLEKMLLVGLALLGAALIVVVIFSLKLTRPLAKLTEATQVISEGNFDLSLSETSGDEIGILSHSMNQMSKKIKELLIESVAKVRIEQEVAIASSLQHNLIPPTSIITTRYTLNSHYQSASECGGDWWGYVETEQELTIMISDATGHGLPPAMLTAATHGCFSAIQKILKEMPDVSFSPSRLLHIANQVIVDSAKSEINMTMFIATYHFANNTLTFANAGHNPPFVIRASDSSGTPKLEMLRSLGARLGEKEEFKVSKDQVVPFTRDDVLFLYTDGLLENLNPNNEEFGKLRVKEALMKATPKSTFQLGTNLTESILSFYNGTIPKDDVTFVMFSKNS